MNILKSQKDRKLGKKRPTGVVVVAILEVLGGISSLAAGGVVMAIPWGAAPGRVASGFGILGGFFAVVAGLIGGILYLVGIADFFIAYGLLKGNSWVWILCSVFAIIGIVLGLILLPFGIIPIIFDTIIIYYLTRPHVKEFFGKAASQSDRSDRSF